MNDAKNKAKNLAFLVKVDHTYLLCNCYGSMVVQTCLPAGPNFFGVCLGKLLLPSTETNSKRTSFWPDFARMTSHQFVLWFRLRFMGAFSNSPVHGSMRLWSNLPIFALHYSTYPSRLSNTFSWQCVIAHTKWWNGKILHMCYWRWVYNQWPPDLLWAANHWTVLRWPHTCCRPLRTHGICPPWHPSSGCYHSQHAGKTHAACFSAGEHWFKDKHVIHTAVLSQNMTWKDEWFWFCFRTMILHCTSITKLFTALYKIK